MLGDINIASLKNLSGAAIYVTGHDSHSQSAGITVSDVGNIVQRHFRLIGLKSISYEAAEKDPRYPAFVVHINVFRNTMDSSYSYSLEFRQNVNLTSSPGLKLHVPTWSFGGQGMANNSDLRVHLLNQIDRDMKVFRDAYLSENRPM